MIWFCKTSLYLNIHRWLWLQKSRLAVCTGSISERKPWREIAGWTERSFHCLGTLFWQHQLTLGAPRESLLKWLIHRPTGNYTPLGALSSAFQSRTLMTPTNPTAFQEACGNHIEEKFFQNYPDSWKQHYCSIRLYGVFCAGVGLQWSIWVPSNSGHLMILHYLNSLLFSQERGEFMLLH